MKPSTNKSSLDAQNYVTEHGKQMKKEFVSIKENMVFSKEKKEALLNALKNSYREEHKSEKHQWVLQKKKEDTDVIRKFGEKIKWDKLTKEEFQWAKEQFYGKSEKKESKETSNNLPSDVATQEKKAIAYFEQNNEANHLKIVDHVKKLREEGKFTYEDLWWGKYAVIMPSGSKKLKMYFPADTHLSDTNYDYTDFDGKEITKKETTRGKLWSKEWKKYVEQKEKEWQKMLSESEFKTLIQSLYPEWTQEEQILAFMMATWFYGRMRLSDKTWDYQRAIKCYRKSDYRYFIFVSSVYIGCSLVHSTFVG